ncbi:GldL-related protein [Flavobacterium sp.]|uniref:GldL-related protein n=1 Tax=Flavobacterium sp. TaxID=239 RepID=UPI0040486656
MKKKYTVPIVLFLLGMAITIIGALFKLMHWPGANFMLIIGMIAEAIAILTLIVTILKKK